MSAEPGMCRFSAFADANYAEYGQSAANNVTYDDDDERE